MVPLPEPEGVAVHQDESTVTAQSVFEVTVKVVVPAGGVTFWLEGTTSNVGIAPA